MQTCDAVPRRRRRLGGELQHAEPQYVERPHVLVLLELPNLLAHMDVTAGPFFYCHRLTLRELAFNSAADVETIIVGCVLTENQTLGEAEELDSER